MYIALGAVLGKAFKDIILSWEVIKQNLIGILGKVLSNKIYTQFPITI